jgi:hypothetical protein
MTGARVSSIAMLIVLASVFPLSLDQDRPFDAFSGDSIEVLTSSESEILNALRQTLSSSNSGVIVIEVEARPEPARVAKGSPVTDQIKQALTAESASAGEPPLQAAEEQIAPESHEPSVEDVISLIQVGQRALRISERGVGVYRDL